MIGRAIPADIPRSFFDACELVRSAGGERACWPADAREEKYLAYFCFPTGLIQRLCVDGTDAIRFTFSFTELARPPSPSFTG